MSHFAEINNDGVVQRIIVAEQDFIDSGAVGDANNWIQTSYNTRCGVHYAPKAPKLLVTSKKRQINGVPI